MYIPKFLYFLIFTILAIISFKLSLFICKKFGFYDIPNKRKIHKYPVLINGGFFLYLNFLLFSIFYLFFIKNLQSIPIRDFFSIALGTTIVFFIGFIDDIKNLKIFTRYFFIFILLCLIFNFANFFLIKNIFIKTSYNSYNFIVSNRVVFSSIVIILFLIMYNLLDGINLFTSLLTIFYLIYFQLYHSNIFLFYLNCYIIISLLIFLYFNFKNISFLGNGGINLLGFILILQMIFLNNQTNLKYQIDLLVLILAFIIPILDMTILFIVRIFLTGNPFVPDRNHLHHLLLKRFSLLATNIILLSIIFFPLFINIFYFNKFVIDFIYLQIFIYLIFIFYLKKKSA